MDKITYEQYKQIQEKMIIDFLKNSESKDRQRLILDWNWDSGTSVLKWIANDPDTDKATALMLYWKSAPRYTKQYADREEALKNYTWGIDCFDLVEEIEKLFLSGFYKNHRFAFDPTNDGGTSWTTEYLDKPIKREIPSVMFEKLTGEDVQSGYAEDWEEGIPPYICEKMREFEVVD